jgi:hypothetical protein
MTKFRQDQESPESIVSWRWKYHHVGIPTKKKMAGETYLPQFGLFVSGFSTSPYGIEWMRFEKDSPINKLIQTVPHVAFEVEDLDYELANRHLKVLTPPNSTADGIRVAMVEHNGAPVELIEFKKNSSVKFDRSLIAPCGMNCGTCMAYLRVKKRCPGCRNLSDSNNISCVRCRVRNCERLEKTASEFCYNCEVFPCLRIKQLDKRYSTKYRTSFIANLMMIKEKGVEYFLGFESERRTCPGCGSVLCVHRPKCLVCGYEKNNMDLKMIL